MVSVVPDDIPGLTAVNADHFFEVDLRKFLELLLGVLSTSLQEMEGSEKHQATSIDANVQSMGKMDTRLASSGLTIIKVHEMNSYRKRIALPLVLDVVDHETSIVDELTDSSDLDDIVLID